MLPSPHIVAVLGLPLLCALCFALGRLTHPRRRGLYLRRGGYIVPSLNASGKGRAATGRDRPTSTGCKPDGPSWAATDGRAELHGLSRTTALSSYGNVTAIPRGGLTTGAGGADAA